MTRTVNAGLVCRFDDCERPASSKQLCKAHHWQYFNGKELTSLALRESMPVINGQKVCTKCRTLKVLEDFYIRTTGIHQSQCKECMKANTAKNKARRRAEQALAASNQ